MLAGEELVVVLSGAELLEVPMLRVASGTVIRDEGMVLLGKVHVDVAEILERGLSIGKILRKHISLLCPYSVLSGDGPVFSLQV